MTLESRLHLCAQLTGLKNYRPKKRRAKRRFKDKRRRIVLKLRAA